MYCFTSSDEWTPNYQDTVLYHTVQYPEYSLLLCPVNPYPSHTPRGNHRSEFFHHRLVWLFLELHGNRITLWCEASLTQSDEIHPCHCRCQQFLLLPRVQPPQFVQSPTDGRLGPFQFEAVMNQAAVNIPVQVFLRTKAFILGRWDCWMIGQVYV